MPTESRTEQLLNAYINGDDISSFVPLSRNEQILKDMILGNEQTSSPQSRIESLYQKLDEKIKEGSGDSTLDISTCLRKMFDESKTCQYLFYGRSVSSYPKSVNYSYNNASDEFLKIFFKDPNITINVLNMQNMFYALFNITTIPKINTSKVTNMYGMFARCIKLTSIPEMDTSNVTDMGYMFNNCYSLTTIPKLNTSKVTNMSHMFYMNNTDPYTDYDNMSYLSTIPEMDTSNVTDMSSMFEGCTNLTTIPKINTSKVTNMYGMFERCTRLTSIPEMDTSNVTNMDGMFGQCHKLVSVPPEMDTSKVTSMSNMFDCCSKLTTIPKLNTSKSTYMSYMFYSCNNLLTITELNLNSATSISNAFIYCTKLSYLKLLNVKINLQIGSGTSWGHLIEKDCLIQIISELIDTGSSKTLTMGTANKEKIADTYVKLLEDDGTGKHPFEVCTSTDEGAMTIEAYCNSKNWILA